MDVIFASLALVFYQSFFSGKKITATATCGEERPEQFCKLTGGTNFEFSSTLDQGQVCDMCDASDLEKSHPIKNAIDGTEKWWQSPPLSSGNQYNHVNITIHLGQVSNICLSVEPLTPYFKSHSYLLLSECETRS